MLAANLLAHLQADASVFWFTIRPGLNDRLSHLLFTLAYFLSRQGTNKLWSQLVADEGRINLDIVLNLLGYDLKKISR